MNVLKTINFWLENARYHAVAQSLWAAVVAVCVALNYSTFNFKFAVLAVIGVILAHLSINLLDDYFDYKLGSVEKRNELDGNIRKGKCKYLLDKKATPKQLFICAGIFGFLAMVAGGFLFYYRGLPVLIFAMFALFLGFFYSAPPFKLSYNGLGELVVGIMFGPLLMNGVFYCATGTVSLQLMLISLAIGSLVTNIVYVHSMMDMKSDEAVGKKTLAVLLKNNYFRLTALVFFAIYPYWVITVGVYRYKMPELLLFIFVTLPLNAVLIKFMLEYINGVKKEHKPKFWMGQFEAWDRIKAIGIEWFMIRWFLARNVMIFFSMVVSAAYIVMAIN